MDAERVEAPLEETVNRRLREFITCFMGTPVGVAFHDRFHKVTHINDTLAAINGMPIDVTIGKTVTEIVPNVGPAVESSLAKVWETGKPILNIEITGETPAQPKIIRYWTCTYFPYRESNRQEVSSVGAVVLEVTQNRLAAEILAKDNQTLEKINALIMGRERRIIELKAEVNVLLSELGRPKRYAS